MHKAPSIDVIALHLKRALLPLFDTLTRYMGRAGLLAYARGDGDGAVDLIYPVRSGAQRFGGSHAQRDLIDQTLLVASSRCSHHAVGRALLNERLMAKPVTPLTRRLGELLGLRC